MFFPFKPNLFDANPSLFDVAMKPNDVPIWLVTRLDNGDYFINYDNPILSESPKYCSRFFREHMCNRFTMRYKDGIVPWSNDLQRTGEYDVITRSGESVTLQGYGFGGSIHGKISGTDSACWANDGKIYFDGTPSPKDLFLKRKTENVSNNTDELVFDNGKIKVVLNGNILNIVHDGSFDIKVSGK